MERLTNRNAWGEVTVSGRDDRDIERKYRAITNRLAELEDKLEDGQAFELPCKIHDKLFTHKKVFGKWQIEELECWGFHADGRNILFIDCQNAKTASSNSLRSFRLEDFGKSVFTDKNQAEARLKELKGNL